jgi:hypothetical protein
MKINNIDNIIYDIILKFNISNNNIILKKIYNENDFIKYLNEIINLIKVYYKKTKEKLLKKNINNKLLFKNIKRYLAYAIFLDIAYHYKGDHNLFLINMIEISKEIKNYNFIIDNFFDSINNQILFKYFNIIKNIITLSEYKTFERISIIMNNNPIKYAEIKLIENILPLELFEKLFNKNNKIDLLNTIIIRLLYFNEEREDIKRLLLTKERKNAEYKFITIQVSKKNKIVDYRLLNNFINSNKINIDIDSIYNFLKQFNKDNYIDLFKEKELIQQIFLSKIFIPISREFIKYHKDNYQYVVGKNKNKDTKIKYILNKLQKFKNLYNETNYKKIFNELIYRNLEFRRAILYNDNEDLKILEKDEKSTTTEHINDIFDLKNYRNYNYINFSNLNIKNFNIVFKEPVDSIRDINILKENKNKFIEYKTNTNVDNLRMIGIILNSNKKFYNTKDLKEVNNITNLKTKFNSNDALYYYIFNNDDDILKTIINIYNSYYNSFQQHIYDIYNKKYNNKSIWFINKYLSKCNNIFNLKIYKNKYKLLKSQYLKNIKDIEFKYIEKPNTPNKVITILKKKKNTRTIKINIKEIGVDNLKVNNSICYHYFMWDSIKKTDSQSIYNFIKTYVKENEYGDYVCKSCNEVLNLKKYIVDGTYVKERDIFLTTNLYVNTDLTELDKYSEYKKIIKNLENKTITVATELNITCLLGLDPITDIRRKQIIMNIIELIKVNYDNLSNLFKNKEKRKYLLSTFNIQKSILIFFPLKNSIFETNSEDTDKLALFKYNNIYVYLLLYIILELNKGNILNMKENKNFNYYKFKQLQNYLFEKSNIMIRLNEKNTIALSKLPLLCYVLYMLANSYIKNNLYLHYIKNDKYEKIMSIRTIIETFVDLINSIVNTYYSKDDMKKIKKSFMFELIVQQFIAKINKIYNDTKFTKTIFNRLNKNVKKGEKGLIFVKRKDKKILINNDTKLKFLYNKLGNCNTETVNIKYKDYNIINSYNNSTNCNDGQLHNWTTDGMKIYCTKCNITYENITKSNTNNTNIINKFKLLKLKELTKNYCIDGRIHNIVNDVCSLCKKNPSTYKYNDKELLLLEKNINNINNIKVEKIIYKKKQMKDSILKNKMYTKKVIENFNSKYNNNTNFINNFFTKIIKVNNNSDRFKIKNKEYYIIKDKFTITNNFNGKKLSHPVIILHDINEKDKFNNRVNIHFHKKLNKYVYVYFNRKQKYYLYYDCYTNLYLGFSSNINDITPIESYIEIQIEYSIKSKLINMGYSSIFINLNKYNINNFNNINKQVITNIIYERKNNLIKIVKHINNILSKTNNDYNKIIIDKEKELIDLLNKDIKSLYINDMEGKSKAFKNINIILKNIKENTNLEYDKHIYSGSDTILNTSLFRKLHFFNKYLFLIIYNFNKLLKYNHNNKIKVLYSFIIIIDYMFNEYFITNNYILNKFTKTIYTDETYLDDSMRVYGVYGELVDDEDIDDEEQYENELNSREEQESLDIDNYSDDDHYFETNDV